MKVGFTGTRRGMTQVQLDQLAFVLGIVGIPSGQEFHYGTHESVRLLADEQARNLAVLLGFTPVPHHARRGEELQRDRDMVGLVDLLVAAPLTDREEVRSGTWATVRYARQRCIPVVMLSRGGRT